MVTLGRELRNIYEINTAVYLNRLSHVYSRPITLANIPDEEIDRIASYGMDTVWLMGVWQRSNDARETSLHDESLMAEIHTILPDAQPEDVIGSAYAVAAYLVSESFGGEVALKQFRERLAARHIKLILDFVPNHTAFDHESVTAHPEYYIQGSADDLKQQPTWYRDCAGKVIAHGRDPHFDAWPDVAQLNAFSSGYREASTVTLTYIASLCDGVRCDMAMLLLNDVFAGTWGTLAGATPASEYWYDIISSVRSSNPNFTFIAECYWDKQKALIDLGFDYCYDKDVYDRLVAHDLESAAAGLAAQTAPHDQLLQFLENHDEPRAASVFDENAHRLALQFVMGLPGAKLWYDGQLEGARIKPPVHIRRVPEEPTDETLYQLYRDTLTNNNDYRLDR